MTQKINEILELINERRFEEAEKKCKKIESKFKDNVACDDTPRPADSAAVESAS